MKLDDFILVDMALKRHLTINWREYYPDLYKSIIDMTPHECIPYCPVCADYRPKKEIPGRFVDENPEP